MALFNPQFPIAGKPLSPVDIQPVYLFKIPYI
jgi:hypothetical protein